MEYTITFTPESVCNLLNRRYDQNFTINQIEDNWEQLCDYIENWEDRIMGDNLWEDFDSVAEEWEIDLFNDELDEE
jgi:hypothetical protein